MVRFTSTARGGVAERLLARKRSTLFFLAVFVSVGAFSLWRMRGCGSGRDDAALLANSSGIAHGPGVWPEFRANAQNTGQVASPGPVIPRLKWQSSPFQPSGVGGEKAPVLSSDGTLFCVTNDAVYAVGPGGKLRWAYELPGRDWAELESPAVGPGGVLYVATRALRTDMPGPFGWFQKNEPGLYALDPNGRLRWKYKGGEPQTDPVLDRQGLIYLATATDGLASSGSQVVALTPKGVVLRKWSVPTDRASAVALREKEPNPWVYYLTTDRALSEDNPAVLLYVLRPDSPIRKVVLPGKAGAALGLVISERENALFALTTWDNSSTLYQIDAATLRVKWQYHLAGQVRTHPAVTTDAIYIGGADTYGTYPQDGVVTHHHHMLYAISHRGRLRWKLALDGELGNSPAVDQRGDVYLTMWLAERDRRNYLYCITPTGQERWRLRISSAQDEVVGAPIIGGHEIIYCYGQRAYANGDASRAVVAR